MEDLVGGVPKPRSYLHVLRNQGFANPEGLLGRFKAWQLLYEMSRPDLIVSDHSPTAVFAAQQYPDAKIVMSGDGFAVPPDTHPFPAFNLEPLYSRETLLEEEQQFLQQHLNPLARPNHPYSRLCDAFKADARWLFMFEGLDHYPDRENDIYLGTGLSAGGDTRLARRETNIRLPETVKDRAAVGCNR